MTADEIMALGFVSARQIKGRWCGVQKFMFTYGLVVGIEEFGYSHRYCYDNAFDPIEALANWDGTGDPSGNWIKSKGRGRDDRPNPNYVERRA